jgi:hypothetical protein
VVAKFVVGLGSLPLGEDSTRELLPGCRNALECGVASFSLSAHLKLHCLGAFLRKNSIEHLQHFYNVRPILKILSVSLSGNFKGC